MRSVRRLYIYSVALISLEVLLWGLISLARSIFCPELVACGGLNYSLARGLALVFVGVPVFLFHWLMAQRFTRQDMEERASGIRAAFLYGVLLGTLIPVVQNILALVNRPVLASLRLSSSYALVGGNQQWSDNLIAILLNLLVAAYFLHILREDWKVIQPRGAYADMRRIYRWVWTLYGLGLTVIGVDQMLRFLLYSGEAALGLAFQRYWAVNGIVAALLGAPLWAGAWTSIQRSLAEAEERASLLRLGLLYLITLVGVIVTLSAGGVILDALLRLLLGDLTTFKDLLEAVEAPLALGIPFLGIWLYYTGWLERAIAEAPDAPRRAGMRRVFLYILAALGVAVVFLGLSFLLSYVIDLALVYLFIGGSHVARLTPALSMLCIGLPLWLLAWRPMQAEAFARDDTGDHARRSLTRRIYLYLALFAGVIGGMVSAVTLLNTVLGALLSGETSGILGKVLKTLAVLALFIGLGVYHGLTMRRDGRISASALSARHAAFPVLILDPGDGFGAAMLAALKAAAPHMPVALQPPDQPLPASPKPLAVVLPSDLAFDLPPSLGKQLDDFSGMRLVVPRAAGRWSLLGTPAHLPAAQAALSLRLVAEGQAARTGGTPGWLIAVYIISALVGLPFLLSLVVSLLSAF